MYSPPKFLSYATLLVFLVVIFVYGSIDSLRDVYSMGTKNTWGPSLTSLKNNPHTFFPDLSRYEPLKTLSSEEFPIGNPARRVIIVGDIHGMMKQLEKLLERARYSPTDDVLIHVGDLATKGPHSGSLAVLRYMSSHNVTGVRGNNDQKLLEWRGWLDFIPSILGATSWLEALEHRWDRAQITNANLTLKSWLKKERKASPPEESKFWDFVPRGWILFSDHYKVARDMSNDDFNYLMNLPLRLYIPSAHTFIVHAGLLPFNPKYPVDDKTRQPLATMPILPRHPHDVHKGSKKTIEDLRNLQEMGILTKIPQNTDPWVVLNMRRVVKGEVSRKHNEGRAWAEMWEEHMENCVGFQYKHHLEEHGSHTGSDSNNNPNSGSATVQKKKSLNLSCHPSTIVFGHAASRGLRIERWSFGLDTGCAREQDKLSALVIESHKKSFEMQQSHFSIEDRFDEDLDRQGLVEDSLEDDDEDAVKGDHSARFGDRGRARIVSVKCSG